MAGAEAAVSYAFKEKKPVAINSFLLYSINCMIHPSDNKSIIILHADLISYSSFMEPERDIYMWVGACVCNLYQALFWPSLPPNFESLGMRLGATMLFVSSIKLDLHAQHCTISNRYITSYYAK